MTNEEKYKTDDACVKAFLALHCDGPIPIEKFAQTYKEFLKWLKSDADDELLPCPYCGNKEKLRVYPCAEEVKGIYGTHIVQGYSIRCICGYRTQNDTDLMYIKRKHNLLCRALANYKNTRNTPC